MDKEQKNKEVSETYEDIKQGLIDELLKEYEK